MNETQDVFQKVGGRKFLLSLFGLAALIIMGSMNPMSVTTEVIVGILGVIATYSGSNSVLTAIMSRGQSAQSAQSAQPSIEEPKISDQVQPEIISQSQNNPIEQRVQALEDAMNSFIEILKVQNDTLNRLTISQNQSNLSKRGLDEGQNNG